MFHKLSALAIVFFFLTVAVTYSQQPIRSATQPAQISGQLRYAVGGGDKNQLANLIISHAFSSDPNNPDTISITLTAQAANAIDPNTQQKRQYTLTETVVNRN